MANEVKIRGKKIKVMIVEYFVQLVYKLKI